MRLFLFTPQNLTPPISISISTSSLLLLLFRFSSSSSTSTSAAGTRVSLYFRRARLIDSLRLRLRLRSSQPFPLPSSSVSTLDSFVAVHALRCAPSLDSAVSFFRSFPSPHYSLFHALAKRLALSRCPAELVSLLDSFPFPPSPMDRLRWLSAAGDVSAALAAWSSLRSSPSLRRGHPCAESYNLVMGLHAAAGDHSAALGTFSQMIREGAIPNSRTYTIVIDHLVSSGFLDSALEVFFLLPSMRVRRTSKQYNVLAEAFSSASRFDELRVLIREMSFDGILPGRAMLEAMTRMRDAGRGEGIDEFMKELSPDERIGYAVDTGEEGEEDGSDFEEEDNDRIRLKPWLDPTALARALDDWDPREIAELEAAKLVWTSRLVCKLLRAFKKAETAWEFFCWVAYQPGGFAHDRHTVARMITILARHGHAELVDRLLSKVKSEGILLPFATVRLVVDFFGLSKKADAAIRVFQDADSICGAISGPNRLLLYSSLLRTMIKCRRGYEAMELLEDMLLQGVLPDVQTFSGLMQYFASIGDLKSVHKLFGMVRQCGLEPDAYMYRVLIRAYCKQERAALALRLFEEMRSSDMAPDGATKTLLVKSLWKEGKLREAASVEERCEEVETGLPHASPGHVWTVSAADFKQVYDIYSRCFTGAGG
ncbi:pentatricopeptide repeat-containing protein At5g66631 [Typha latifolia]|uniref:pentatricopeptide repeat-containing protein At5g66631 n=1 Tax=Typha latifolia TaxID=4733 RepID=UPI003C30CC08